MDFISIFTNPWFWTALAALAAFSYGTVQTLGLSKLPIFNNPTMLLLVGLVGIGATTGVFSLFGTGSLDDQTSNGVIISDLQVTTAFAGDATIDAAGTACSQNSQIDNLMDCRFLDNNVSETGGAEEVYTGILTVRRTGSLVATACDVEVVMPQSYVDEAAPGTTALYNIVEKTTLGEYEVYYNAGGAATTSSPKQSISLPFTEGDADNTLGIAMEIDEEGHDALEPYSYRDVTTNVCGTPYTVRIHRMD